jgi:hypothetical protein
MGKESCSLADGWIVVAGSKSRCGFSGAGCPERERYGMKITGFQVGDLGQLAMHDIIVCCGL